MSYDEILTQIAATSSSMFKILRPSLVNTG